MNSNEIKENFTYTITGEKVTKLLDKYDLNLGDQISIILIDHDRSSVYIKFYRPCPVYPKAFSIIPVQFADLNKITLAETSLCVLILTVHNVLARYSIKD